MDVRETKAICLEIINLIHKKLTGIGTYKIKPLVLSFITARVTNVIKRQKEIMT